MEVGLGAAKEGGESRLKRLVQDVQRSRGEFLQHIANFL